MLLLPDSPFYPVLSTLPPPDPTNPTATTTFVAQSAIHNSHPILEELVSIHEHQEKAFEEAEVAKRRQRIGAGSPEETKRQVMLEILAKSQV